MYAKRNYASFNFDTLIDSLSPRQITLLIAINSFLTAIIYVSLAEGNLAFWPVLITTAFMPIAAFLLWFMWVNYGPDRWFVALILYVAMPVLMHGFAHLLGYLGSSTTADIVHNLRWWSLALPYVLAFAYTTGLMTWYRLTGRSD